LGPACPACGTELPPGEVVCPGCGLASELFVPLRSALAAPEGDRPAPHLASEIATAVGESGPAEAAGPAEFAHPARFPAARGASPPRAPPASSIAMPELPALPPGEPRRVLRGQIDEFLTLGRRLGLDLSAIEPRVRDAIRGDDVGRYADLRRELFVHLAARLAERLEEDRARRNELVNVPAADPVDPELSGWGERIEAGDLSGAYRHLRPAEDRLALLEEQWETVRILSLEGELLADTVRELGGDPAPALGPLAAARRRAEEGDREGAEPLLARSILALWQLAAPLLVGRLTELKEQLDRAEGQGGDPRFARAELKVLAREVRAHNLGAAVLAYRRARDAAARFDVSGAAPVVRAG
jgi:hypothetical protein